MSHAVLLVGLGQIGMGYDLQLEPGRVYTHARAFSSHPAFRLAAAVDLDPERRARFSAAYGVPAYATLEQACAADAVDVLVIATPTAQHADTLGAALALCQPRAVLCEKPLAYAPDQARAMVALCAQRGVALYVNYPRRSDLAVVEVGRRIEAGQIAGPLKGVAWYSKGFLNNGSHFFNLLEGWLGPMLDAQLLERGREWDGVDPEPDVRVRFARGSVLFVAAWEEAYSHYTIELMSPSGRLRYEKRGTQVQWQAACSDPEFPGYTVLGDQPEMIASGMERFQWHVADQLAHALDGVPAHLCSGEEALATLINMNTILQARST